MNGEGFGKVYSYLFSVNGFTGFFFCFHFFLCFWGYFFGSKRRPFCIPVGSKTPLAWNFGRSIECSLSTFLDSGGPLFGSRRQKQFCTPFSFRSFLHFSPSLVSLCLNCVSSLFYSCEWANCPFENMLARNAHSIPIHLDRVHENLWIYSKKISNFEWFWDVSWTNFHRDLSLFVPRRVTTSRFSNAHFLPRHSKLYSHDDNLSLALSISIQRWKFKALDLVLKGSE